MHLVFQILFQIVKKPHFLELVSQNQDRLESILALILRISQIQTF